MTFRNTLLAISLALTPLLAQAEHDLNFIRFEGIHYNYYGDHNNKDGFNLTLGREFAPGLKLDIKQEFRAEEHSQKDSNRFEVGAQLEENLGLFKVGVRTALGQKFTGTENFPYYSVEPFVSYDVNKDWTLKTSYRYRNAFEDSHDDRTNTYKFGVDYNYSNHSVIGVSIGKTVGDSDYTAIQAGYTYKF